MYINYFILNQNYTKYIKFISNIFSESVGLETIIIVNKVMFYTIIILLELSECFTIGDYDYCL